MLLRKSLQICKCVSEQNCLSGYICVSTLVYLSMCTCVCETIDAGSLQVMYAVSLHICVHLYGRCGSLLLSDLCICVRVSSCAVIGTVSYKPWPLTCPDSCYLSVH